MKKLIFLILILLFIVYTNIAAKEQIIKTGFQPGGPYTPCYAGLETCKMLR